VGQPARLRGGTRRNSGRLAAIGITPIEARIGQRRFYKQLPGRFTYVTYFHPGRGSGTDELVATALRRTSTTRASTSPTVETAKGFVFCSTARIYGLPRQAASDRPNPDPPGRTVRARNDSFKRRRRKPCAPGLPNRYYGFNSRSSDLSSTYGAREGGATRPTAGKKKECWQQSRFRPSPRPRPTTTTDLRATTSNSHRAMGGRGEPPIVCETGQERGDRQSRRLYCATWANS